MLTNLGVRFVPNRRDSLRIERLTEEDNTCYSLTLTSVPAAGTLSAALLSGCASTERKERATGVPKADIYKPGGPNQALDKIAYDKRHSRALNISRLALMLGHEDRETDDQK